MGDAAEGQDLLRGGGVHRLRFLVGKVVGQIRADHHERLLAAPVLVEHAGDLFGHRLSHCERRHGFQPKRDLKEGQLHFERVLSLVGTAVPGKREVFHGDIAEGRAHRSRVRQRQPADVHEVRRSHQHDARERGIHHTPEGGGGDGAGIDVSGVWGDHRLWHRPRPRRREQSGDGLAELDRVGRIEAARDGRGAHGVHAREDNPGAVYGHPV